MIIFRQPGANIIDTVDRIREALLAEGLHPAGHRFQIVLDRTITIRASVSEVERTLLISIGLVILVVFVFLRNRARHADSQRRRAGFADRHVWRDVSVRLQHRQSFADGADHFHGIRGGRRHRGDREHHAATRKGHAPDGSGACRAPEKSASPFFRSAFRWSPCSFRSC